MQQTQTNSLFHVSLVSINLAVYCGPTQTGSGPQICDRRDGHNIIIIIQHLYSAIMSYADTEALETDAV